MRQEGPWIQPTYLLITDHPLKSLTNAQGLIILAAVRCSRSLGCVKVLHQQPSDLDDFVAPWISKLGAG